MNSKYLIISTSIRKLWCLYGHLLNISCIWMLRSSISYSRINSRPIHDGDHTIDAVLNSADFPQNSVAAVFVTWIDPCKGSPGSLNMHEFNILI